MTPAASTRSSGSNAFLPSPTDDDAMLGQRSTTGRRRDWEKASTAVMPNAKTADHDDSHRRDWASASAVGANVLLPSPTSEEDQDRDLRSQTQYTMGRDRDAASQAPSGYSGGRGGGEDGTEAPRAPPSRGSQGSHGSGKSRSRGLPPVVAGPVSRGSGGGRSVRGSDASGFSRSPRSHAGGREEDDIDDVHGAIMEVRQASRPTSHSSGRAPGPAGQGQGRPGSNASSQRHGHDGGGSVGRPAPGRSGSSRRGSGGSEPFVSPLTDDDTTNTTVVRQGSPTASTTSGTRRRSPRSGVSSASSPP